MHFFPFGSQLNMVRGIDRALVGFLGDGAEASFQVGVAQTSLPEVELEYLSFFSFFEGGSFPLGYGSLRRSSWLESKSSRLLLLLLNRKSELFVLVYQVLYNLTARELASSFHLLFGILNCGEAFLSVVQLSLLHRVLASSI